jgi:hypothetical protein
VPIVLKYGSLILLEPSGPVKACNGIALNLALHNFKKRLKTGNLASGNTEDRQGNVRWICIYSTTIAA